MSCDHELANEWERCSGKNASYITIEFIYLSIAYPDITLNHTTTDPANSIDVNKELLYNSVSSEKAIR